ncbi:MAG: cbb3-type cytochrome c oxidase subunit II [Verrucomicrobia bacterium]|nr:cbb3-type cytochrome c oxidase subunit II [Verrucomicrobiota bacterium]
MNRLGKLVFGVFAAFGIAWTGLVAYPILTFAGLKQATDEASGDLVPPPKPGVAEQGYHVYAANGCVYCHSQYVRDPAEGADIDRKWGKRRTVARDYIFDRHVFLGNSRSGADLTNLGVRQTDAQWYYRELYSPRLVHPETTMPAYRWLFRTQKISGQASDDALKIEGPESPAAGFEIVPTAQGKALVAYLLSLKRDYPLPEAPEPAQ